MKCFTVEGISVPMVTPGIVLDFDRRAGSQSVVVGDYHDSRSQYYSVALCKKYPPKTHGEALFEANPVSLPKNKGNGTFPVLRDELKPEVENRILVYIDCFAILPARGRPGIWCHTGGRVEVIASGTNWEKEGSWCDVLVVMHLESLIRIRPRGMDMEYILAYEDRAKGPQLCAVNTK